jgi:outer membrane lipoprotein-sorting protein
MYKILIIFFLLILVNKAQAKTQDEIISKLEKIDNLSFNFKQTINEKNENGSCIVKYPKKIFCEYNNINKKIMVSNGTSLVIKNKNSGTYYFYALKRTPLELILDKNYLINQIKNMEGRFVNDKYFNFTIVNNDNKINIFFDNQTLNLIGWQTEDIYQNLVITFMSKIKVNQKINKNIFTLPSMN